jgi:hypothetical protein
MEILNPEFQISNKLKLPIPKLMKRVFYDLVLCHWVIGYYLVIGACLQ